MTQDVSKIQTSKNSTKIKKCYKNSKIENQMLKS